MFRWMNGKTRKGRIRMKLLEINRGITPIEDKLRETD